MYEQMDARPLRYKILYLVWLTRWDEIPALPAFSHVPHKFSVLLYVVVPMWRSPERMHGHWVITIFIKSSSYNVIQYIHLLQYFIFLLNRQYLILSYTCLLLIFCIFVCSILVYSKSSMCLYFYMPVLMHYSIKHCLSLNACISVSVNYIRILLQMLVFLKSVFL